VLCTLFYGHVSGCGLTGSVSSVMTEIELARSSVYQKTDRLCFSKTEVSKRPMNRTDRFSLIERPPLPRTIAAPLALPHVPLPPSHVPRPSHAAATSRSLTGASTATARRTRKSRPRVPRCRAGAPSPVVIPAPSPERAPVKTAAATCPPSTGQNSAKSARLYL
jgi:hypothetical protein